MLLTNLQKQQYIEDTKNLNQKSKDNDIVLAERLWNIADKQINLGMDYSLYQVFDEVGIPKTTGYRMIGVYKKFVIELKYDKEYLKSLGFSKLWEIKDLCIDKESSDEWINYALHNPIRELIKMVKNKKSGGKDFMKCPHERLVEYYLCKDCQEHFRKYPK